MKGKMTRAEELKREGSAALAALRLESLSSEETKRSSASATVHFEKSTFFPLSPSESRSSTDPPETARAKWPRAEIAAAAASSREVASAAASAPGEPCTEAETSAVRSVEVEVAASSSSAETWYWNWCGVTSMPGPDLFWGRKEEKKKRSRARSKKVERGPPSFCSPTPFLLDAKKKKRRRKPHLNSHLSTR